jgi:pre-mRNA-splicing helicase BRR2
MVLDCDEEYILFSHHITLRKDQPELLIQFIVPLFEIMHPLYYIKVISDRWICPESCLPLSFRSIILPSKFPQPLELQDLQPMAIGSLGNFGALAKDLKISHLNQMQTQVFPAIANSSGNVLIGAAAGSGKFTLALFAVLKCLEAGRKAVIMEPNQDVLNLQFELVQKAFPNKVCSLSGQATKDTAKLSSFDIIMTTPEAWDAISRRWKTRKGFDFIGLFVADLI